MAKPKRKYESLIGKYPEIPPGEGAGDFKDQVRAHVEEYKRCTDEELMDMLSAREDSKEEQEENIKALNVEIEAINRVLVDRFTEQKKFSVTLADGRTFSKKITAYPQVKDRPALEAYIVSHPDLDFLYKVDTKTLGGYVGELMLEGRDADVPDGVEFFLKSTISQTKRS